MKTDPEGRKDLFLLQLDLLLGLQVKISENIFNLI